MIDPGDDPMTDAGAADAATHEWSFVEVADVVTDAVGDRDMLICGTSRRSYAEVRDRTRALARFLVDRGIGAHRERSDLAGHEIGQDTVALVLHNGVEYIESMYAAYRARTAPFNVNQHYRPAELAALFDQLAPRVVVYHGAYAALVESCVSSAQTLCIRVADGNDDTMLPGSINFEDAIAEGLGSHATLPATSGDDCYVVCTGGTTGRPKAVLWRQADVYVAGMAGRDDATAESIAAAARGWSAGPWYAVPPLMHAAAQWTAFSGLHLGGTVLVHDDSGGFDARNVLATAAAHGAFMITLVGDAYVRPIVAEIATGRHDLSALRIIGTGGAATSAQYKDALTAALPGAVIRDGYGASETGGMAFTSHTAGAPQGRFAAGAGATVVSEDRTRFLEAGDDELGWIARRGHVPLGYLGDADATAATFPVIDGVRVAVPGDRGHLTGDGSIELVGRDALVVNTGGEKVFVEEVEDVLRSHPDVVDALVVGRPSERFGSEVTACVAVRDDVSLDGCAVRAFVAERIARFKAPRAVVFCEQIQRLANGKGDYVWAAERARDAVDATGAS